MSDKNKKTGGGKPPEKPPGKPPEKSDKDTRVAKLSQQPRRQLRPDRPPPQKPKQYFPIRK